MPIIRSSQHLNETIIRTPQGDIRFNFGLPSIGVHIENEDIGQLVPFSPKQREEVELLLNRTLNPPSDSSGKVKELQAKFNTTIIATLQDYGKPLDIGTSPQLTREFAGGALTHEINKTNHVVLGLNLDEISQTKYKGTDGKLHPMKQEDIVRHELFHFVDVDIKDFMLKEFRAVWFVNQFQIEEGRPQRVSYFTPNDIRIPGIMPQEGGYNGRLMGVKIPGWHTYPAPSAEMHHQWQHKPANKSEIAPHSRLSTPQYETTLSIQEALNELTPKAKRYVTDVIERTWAETSVSSNQELS